jgi:hypothetical protein
MEPRLAFLIIVRALSVMIAASLVVAENQRRTVEGISQLFV